MRSALAFPLLLALSGCPSDPSFEPWLLDPLPADQGFTVIVPEFDVPSGTEIQSCYFFKAPDLNNGNDYWVNRTTIALNPGSHHTNVFRVRTIAGLGPDDGTPVDLGSGIQGTVVEDGECWNSGNWSDWPLVANSQNSAVEDPYTDWQFPSGVAERFTPGEWLVIQTHYVNATTQETPWKGRVGMSFYLSDETSPQELGTLFATQQSIRVCASQPTSKYAGTCSIGGTATTVLAANGHFHSRGTRFRMFSWDGTSETEPPPADMFYESTVWDDPPMARDLSTPIPAGGGVWWSCEYQWAPPSVGCEVVDARDPQHAGDCCYTFGGIVESSEHCNAFIYYYPKVDSTDIFCN